MCRAGSRLWLLCMPAQARCCNDLPFGQVRHGSCARVFRKRNANARVCDREGLVNVSGFRRLLGGSHAWTGLGPHFRALKGRAGASPCTARRTTRSRCHPSGAVARRGRTQITIALGKSRWVFAKPTLQIGAGNCAFWTCLRATARGVRSLRASRSAVQGVCCPRLRGAHLQQRSGAVVSVLGS